MRTINTRGWLFLITLGLATLCASCSDEALPTAPNEETPHSITLHLNCNMGDSSASLTTRTASAHSPFYENVITSLFALHFDAADVCLNCTDYTEVSGYLTATSYEINIANAVTDEDNVIYVLCNFPREVYDEIKGEYQNWTIKEFKEKRFSLESLKNPTGENSTFLPAYGIYRGAIKDGDRLNILLSRYVASFTLELLTANSSTTFSNVKLGLINAPKYLHYIAADNAEEYPTLTQDDVFSESEMQDVGISVTSTSVTTAATRYFYVGENLSSDEAMQVKLHLSGVKKVNNVSTEFDVTVPLTSSGLVDRNTYVESQLVLE
jgi:hypothetical protein